MVTPLRGRDELDLSGLEQLIERILSGGVAGIFILGTTGEGPSLSYRLRRELIERTCRQVRARVPVLVGITDTAFMESVSLARHAAAVGADALVLAPLSTFRKVSRNCRNIWTTLWLNCPCPCSFTTRPRTRRFSTDWGPCVRQWTDRRSSVSRTARRTWIISGTLPA